LVSTEPARDFREGTAKSVLDDRKVRSWHPGEMDLTSATAGKPDLRYAPQGRRGAPSAKSRTPIKITRKPAPQIGDDLRTVG
jgi:hypothetical protein